jgi:polysaccharide export outer membrane protein
MRKKSIVGSGFLSLFIAGIMTVPGYAQTLDLVKTATGENYSIGPGDVIDVTISKNEQLSKSGLRVSDAGTVQLAMLDEDVLIACQTEREAADTIREKYRKYLVNPYVNVAVKEFNSNPVALIGAVRNPGRFQMQRPMRLLELLSLVNGPAEKAGDTVEIIRSTERRYCSGGSLVSNNSDELISLPLTEALKGVESANPYLKAGDIVRLVEMDSAMAYVHGNVRTAVAVRVADSVTLSQAIAMAGGLTSGADSSQIKIRRQVPNSVNRREIVVNLKAINSGKADDLVLEASDIVDVPGPSGGKKIWKGLVDRLLPSITSLPTRIIPF